MGKVDSLRNAILAFIVFEHHSFKTKIAFNLWMWNNYFKEMNTWLIFLHVKTTCFWSPVLLIENEVCLWFYIYLTCNFKKYYLN